ncbi:hypothetical protein N0V82_008475 [Gnomoniopsis sp. IMI 355080]|nr:hypothetical protein N0V82_008475 [Gnomoniopsis sp. IMI 355080]
MLDTTLFSQVDSYLTIQNGLLVAGMVYLTYWACIYVYRVTWHPLAKFPGPKLAGASFWYEFYYDLWPHYGRYMWKIKELHDEYGPIVRINPNFIHIHDPDYFEEIYAGGKRVRDRDPWFLHNSDKGLVSGSLLQTMDHETHRMRRGALNPFFSKRAILQLEDLLVEKIDILLDRLGRACKTSESVNLSYAVAALSFDMATAYALGADLGNLRREDWGSDWLDAFRVVGQIRPLGRQFPFLVNTVMGYLTPEVVEWFSPSTANLSRKLMYPMRILQSVDAKVHPASVNSKTIFLDIIDSNLPPSEKTPERLNAETFSALGGVETMTRTLAVTIFYLFESPVILQKLRAELKTVITHPGDNVTLAQLEALPYLGLRITTGITTRMPRVAPNEDLQYKEWVIPAGIYLTIAKLLTRFDMDVSNTQKERDIDVHLDLVVGMPRADSPGIQVKITKDWAE